MSTVIGTIDITPTREEHARVTAYIIGSHLRGKNYSFGDYWNYTRAQEDAIFATWNALESIHNVYREAGMDFWNDCPQAHKAKLIMALHARMLEEVTAE
jgi:hypothetical protein